MSVIQFPTARIVRPMSEAEAWDAYLCAVAELNAEHPNTNVSTCRRVVEAYDRFCVEMMRGGRHG